MEVFLKHLGIALDYTREMLIVALILARTMPMVVLTPFLAGKLVPPTVKMGMGLLFTILLWPLARDAVTGPLPIGPIAFLMLMLKEVFVGFAIGFVNAHIYWALEMAGRIIDTARMTSMSEVMDPHSKQRVTPFGNMLYQLFLVIFVVLGGHHIFIEAYFYSFVSIPLNEHLSWGPGLGPFFEHMLRLSAHIILIAAILAAPIVAATLISDVVFGILNRVAPQLNAYFMSMPVKALGGVVMAFVILEPFVSRLFDFVTWALRSVEETLARLVVG